MPHLFIPVFFWVFFTTLCRQTSSHTLPRTSLMLSALKTSLNYELEDSAYDRVDKDTALDVSPNEVHSFSSGAARSDSHDELPNGEDREKDEQPNNSLQVQGAHASSSSPSSSSPSSSSPSSSSPSSSPLSSSSLTSSSLSSSSVSADKSHHHRRQSVSRNGRSVTSSLIVTNDRITKVTTVNTQPGRRPKLHCSRFCEYGQCHILYIPGLLEQRYCTCLPNYTGLQCHVRVVPDGMGQ